MSLPAHTAAKLSSIPDFKAFLDEGWRAHTAKRRPNAPTVISTFAGCGGSSLGYSMNGFRELLAVEFNPYAAQTFRDNFPEVDVYEGDIAKLSVGECLERHQFKSW
jgi:Site-specific DNA methylase